MHLLKSPPLQAVQQLCFKHYKQDALEFSFSKILQMEVLCGQQSLVAWAVNSPPLGQCSSSSYSGGLHILAMAQHSFLPYHMIPIHAHDYSARLSFLAYITYISNVESQVTEATHTMLPYFFYCEFMLGLGNKMVVLLISCWARED